MKSINIIALSLVSVLLISLVYAVTGVIQTDIFYDGSTLEPVDNVQEILYTCSDSDCDSQGSLVLNKNTGSSNSLTFEYPYNPSSTESNPDYYSHFSFAECYLPKEYKEWIWGYGANLEYDYYMQKAESCHSPIDSFSVTNHNYVNEPVVINMQADFEADAHSAFTDLVLDWFPAGYEDYYSVETRVNLNIYNSEDEVVFSDYVDLNILMDTSENVEFEWTPTEVGEYVARIETHVTDCQCSSSYEEYAEREFVIWEERPQNECYTIINDLEAVPEFGEKGVLTTISYNKISNYADEDHDKFPVKTNVIYQIFKQGVEVFTDVELLNANPNTENPITHTFDWTPEEGGEYTIKVTGVAQSEYCIGKTNPEDVAILGYSVDGDEKYNVEFVVKDSKTYEALEGAEIEFGIQSGLTNSAGKVSFNVNEGNYDWLVSFLGYIPEGGNVYVNENMIIEVYLDEIILMDEYDVKFIVKDSKTYEALEGVDVEIGPFSGLTNSEGEVSFILLEGNYDWLVSFLGYIPEGGNVYVNENMIIEVYLDEIILMQFHDAEFIVIDCDNSEILEDALVDLDIFEEYTDSSGYALFADILDGTYFWEISKTDYYSKTGSFLLDDDESFNVCLNKIPDLNESLTEVEVLFPNGGETIRGNINILWEAVNNLGRNLLMDVYYSEDGGLSFVKIADDTENDGTLSWNTKNVKNGNKYLIKVCAYEGIAEEEVCDISDAWFNVDNDDDDKKKSKSHSQISLSDELCTPLWDCSIVSDCVNGFKTLECIDLNQCDYVYDKPDEKVACLEPQPVLIGEQEEQGFQLSWLIALLLIAIVFLVVIIILLR